MKMNQRWTLMCLVATLTAVGMSGCTPQAQEKYNEAGVSASDAAKKTGDAIATDASATGKVISEKAKEAGKALDADGVSAKVKGAFATAKSIDSSHIEVDTVDKTVTLKGSVPTAEQKKLAEDTAKTQVGAEYTVVDNLTVAQAK